MKPLQIREQFLNQNIRIFTQKDFQRLFNTSYFTTRNLLEKYLKEGLFIRLRNGVYALKTDQPAEEEIANALYKPSYISFEYALAFWNIIPEMTYSITSATTKPTRTFTIGESGTYSYFTIKKEAYTGYLLQKNESKNYLIAEPEKALADYLYYVSIGHRTLNSRLDLKNIQREKLIEYAKLFGRKKLLILIQTL